MKNKATIIILHGWGKNGTSYSALKSFLQLKKYVVYVPDLPGFGNEPLVNDNMYLDDYVEFVHTFIKKKKLSDVIFIGHSFGGRVSLKYTWKYPGEISKLILSGVPVIRHKSFPKNVIQSTSKFGSLALKKFPQSAQKILRKSLYFVIGEWDYYNSGPLKEVFKNIINEDLVKYAKEIDIPVLLVWGKNDQVTPFNDALKMQSIIKNSKLIGIENGTHKIPYEDAHLLARHVVQYLNS